MSGKSKTGAAHRAPRRSIADLIDQKEILTADGRKERAKTEGVWIWRYEVVKFFNSSFCCNILEAYMPDTDIEAALKNMCSKSFNDRQLALGRGYAFQKRKPEP